MGKLADSSIALSNSGSAPITISQIGVAGQMFALASPNQLPINIEPGSTHTVKVGFTPATDRDFSGELTVMDSAAKPIAQVPMYGRGAPHGQLVASPDALSFGSIATGSVNSQTLNLSWTGSYPVTINSITTSGSGFSTAALSLPLTVYPGQPLALTVQFAPISQGSVTGQISIGWGTREDSTVIGLDGMGAAAAAVPDDAGLGLSATQLDFGSVPVNSATTQSITVTSTGRSPLTLTAATIAGAGFTLIGGTLPVTVSPSQPATLQIQFTPTTTGTMTGQLALSSNASTGTTIISLSGTGLAVLAPQLTVSATKLSFGSVTVNSATAQAITLTSTGTAPVTVSSATVSGSGFSLSGGSLPITLAPMQSTTLQVKFEATSTGTSDGQLTINSDSTTGGTTLVALDGVGAAAPSPQLTVSAAALSFGSVTVNSATTQALTLTSTGTSPVTVSAATITGGGFTLVGGSIPAILAPNQSTTLQVQFAPTTAGSMAGQLVLTSDSNSGGTTTISLSGTSTAAPNPQLSLSAAKLSFGTVTLNSPTTQALTLTSTGTSPVTVSAAAVAGAGFTISGGTLPITLNPMESTTLQVQFDPMTTGTLDGQLTINSDSTSGNTLMVSLEGAGAAAPVPQLTVSAGALSFGNVTVNSATTQAVTLTSTGTAPVTVSAATITGAGFSLVNAGIPVTLAAGQSITLNVQFAPTTTGSLTGQLTLSSDSSSGTTTLVSLSGTSTAVPTPQLTLNAMTLTFDAEPVGTGTTQVLTLTSTGTATLTIQSASITGAGFGITGGSFPTTLNPGQSMSVQVTFVPITVGSTTGQLTISSDSASGSSAVVALNGAGLALAHEIDLSWDAPTTSPDPVAGYNVYRALGNGGFQLVNSTPLTSTAYVDTALASGSTYNYVVKSVDANSVESSASSGITVSVP